MIVQKENLRVEKDQKQQGQYQDLDPLTLYDLKVATPDLRLLSNVPYHKQ
jgi:hypothetical protein